MIHEFVGGFCPTTVIELHTWIVVSGTLFAVFQIGKNLARGRFWSRDAVAGGISGTSAPVFLFLLVAPLAPETIKLMTQDAPVYLHVAGIAGCITCVEVFLSGWTKGEHLGASPATPAKLSSGPSPSPPGSTS